MHEDMTGKVALVTGASRGIGAAVACAFRSAGARVAIAARDAEALDQLADELGRSEGQALAVPTDVSDSEAVVAMIRRVLSEFGRLDIVRAPHGCQNSVHTAGSFGSAGGTGC